MHVERSERGISLSLLRVPRVAVEMHYTLGKRDGINREWICSHLSV
jgi:hypothetical protein